LSLSQSNKRSRHLANKNELDFFEKIRKIVLNEVKEENKTLKLKGKFIKVNTENNVINEVQGELIPEDFT